MLAVDQEFLFVSESCEPAEPDTLQNCLKLLLVGLQFWKTLLSQNHFIFTSDRIEIRITKEKIGKFIQHSIFQFSRAKPGRNRWNNSRQSRRGKRNFRVAHIWYHSVHNGSHFYGCGNTTCRRNRSASGKKYCQEDNQGFQF